LPRNASRGELPATVRTFLFDGGTIGNYSYLAIPFNASNRPGALVVINYLLSVESLLDQGRMIGSIFPLERDRLTPADRERAAAVTTRTGNPAA
jgi:putative thiamine transport system substrate-binding protein